MIPTKGIPTVMNNFKHTGNRRSIRLKGYDYSQQGMYFITICTKNRECLFGKIQDGNMILNDCGSIADQQYQKIPLRFPNAILDKYIIMPNHIHGIIQLEEVPLSLHRTTVKVVPTLGEIIGAFKSECTSGYLKYININNLNRSCMLWQKNYYEHIIRNETGLAKIREYIQNNPVKWDEDKENPKNFTNRTPIVGIGLAPILMKR